MHICLGGCAPPPYPLLYFSLPSPKIKSCMKPWHYYVFIFMMSFSNEICSEMIYCYDFCVLLGNTKLEGFLCSPHDNMIYCSSSTSPPHLGLLLHLILMKTQFSSLNRTHHLNTPTLWQCNGLTTVSLFQFGVCMYDYCSLVPFWHELTLACQWSPVYWSDLCITWLLHKQPYQYE